MAIANVIRVSIKGTLPGGEIWSVNPVFQLGGVSTAEDITPDMAQAMATACAAVAVPAGLLGTMSSGTAVTGIRVEARRWNGDLAALAEAVKGTPQNGSGTAAHPYQTSIVFSLRTPGIGGSGRGRVYWPATAFALSLTTLRPTGANVTTVLTAMKAYLASLTSALETVAVNDMHLAVWSRLNESTIWVTSIQAGDVLDTQRRRRDAQIETYQTVTFP